jgi:uncharacterized protein YqeY
MNIKERLTEDMKTAMKEKDKDRLSVIRMARNAIQVVEKAKLQELDEEQVVEVLTKEVKMRKEAIEEFKKGNRQDLVDKNLMEIDVLMEYLPQQLTEEEIAEIVQQAVIDTGAQSIKEMGRVMSAIMPKVKGRADGKLVNQIVKQHLQEK